MNPDDGRTRFWVEGQRCPRCDSSLISDGKHVWCSFVGGWGEKACEYGMEGEDILLDGGEKQ